jgi:undecaprenyl-diphosphatase
MMGNIDDLILLAKYIFLGLFQGFTEPIPVSSSGHLIILRELLHIEIKGLSFEILVNAGSLVAVLLVYRRDIIRMIRNGFRFPLTGERAARTDLQLILLLLIATIPAGVIGLLFKDYISSTLSEAAVVGGTLLLTGLALWIIRNLSGKRDEPDLTVKDAVIVGLAQAAALIPGISRSGATIVAAMLVGMRKETALRFSFLLYIPVSLGITVLSIGDIVRDPEFDMLMIPYLLAFMASIIATFYALKWFIHMMVNGKLKYFSFYCFAAGLLVFLFL